MHFFETRMKETFSFNSAVIGFFTLCCKWKLLKEKSFFFALSLSPIHAHTHILLGTKICFQCEKLKEIFTMFFVFRARNSLALSAFTFIHGFYFFNLTAFNQK
jgi:hypothetical protein